jgi:hypothetical protein
MKPQFSIPASRNPAPQEIQQTPNAGAENRAFLADKTAEKADLHPPTG